MITNVSEMDSYLLNFITLKCMAKLMFVSKEIYYVIKNEQCYKTLQKTKGNVEKIHDCCDIKLIKIIYNDKKFETKINYLYIAAKRGKNLICKYIFNFYKNLYFDKKSIISYSIKKNDSDLFFFFAKNNANIHAKQNRALMYATKYNNYEILKFLVDKGVYVNDRNGTALANAAATGNVKIVKYLHSHGAILDINDHAALKSASENGCVTVFKYIEKHSLNIENNIINKCFEYACLCCSFDLVKYLCSKYVIKQSILNYGFIDVCDGNSLISAKYLYSRGVDINYNSGAAIYKSVKRNNIEVVEWLCKIGVDVSLDNYIVLSSAIIQNNILMVSYILTYYPEIYKSFELSKSLLNDCILFEYYELFTIIYKNCVKYHSSISYYSLIKSIEKKKYMFIKFILKDKYLYFLNSYGVHPLTHSCAIGDIKIVKLLIKKYRDCVSGCDLVEACKYGNTDVVELLLEAGVNPNYEMNLPLHIAAENGNANIINLLIKYGASVGINSSVLITAAANYNIEAIKLIIKNIKCSCCKKRKRS